MAQAIDIDVDDANRLPTHWLHAAYAGADAPALIAARKAEVAGLFLGDAKERGVRDACARGDQAYVARACGTLKSLGDLRVPISAQERCDWARACVDGANVADAPVASSAPRSSCARYRTCRASPTPCGGRSPRSTRLRTSRTASGSRRGGGLWPHSRATSGA